MANNSHDDHSWVSDYVHASNGWRNSGSAAGTIGKQVRDNRIATEKFVAQQRRAKSGATTASPAGSQVHPGSLTARAPYWLVTIVSLIGILISLAAAGVGAWFSFFEMPEIVALELWKRIPAALGLGLVFGGLTYGLLGWLVVFVIDVLLPLLFRLALFCIMMGGLFLAANTFL